MGAAIAGPNPQQVSRMVVARPDKEDPELEFLASSTLTRRKDYLGVEEEAKQAPNRMLYYRKNADVDRLIEVCSEKLQRSPQNFRALYLRASSFAKKGVYSFRVSCSEL